jgi:uncharacterized protein (DUF3820 family)
MEDRHNHPLWKIANMKMPFGKYQGVRLCDLPEPYVVWFHARGFPKGELGMLLSTVYEIKLNGLEYLVKPLREPRNGSATGRGAQDH